MELGVEFVPTLCIVADQSAIVETPTPLLVALDQVLLFLFIFIVLDLERPHSLVVLLLEGRCLMASTTHLWLMQVVTTVVIATVLHP